MTAQCLMRVSIRCDDCGRSDLFDVSARQYGIKRAREAAWRAGWRNAYQPPSGHDRRYVDLCPDCAQKAGIGPMRADLAAGLPLPKVG